MTEKSSYSKEMTQTHRVMLGAVPKDEVDAGVTPSAPSLSSSTPNPEQPLIIFSLDKIGRLGLDIGSIGATFWLNR